MRKTVIDFETNGFQGSDVLSFSWAHDKGDNCSMVLSRYYYPRGEYNEKAIAVNGLTKERITELRGDADYPQYYDEDSEFIASVLAYTNVIVAHNIAFDYSFLLQEVIPKNCQVFCTMKSNTKYFDKNPKLKEAAEYYGIEVAEENLHGSAYDVELCLAIYNAMEEKDKTPNDDFLTKVYAARNEYGNMIHPFGKWKGFSYSMFAKKDCEEFLKKYNGPHMHEMYEDVFSWNEILMQRIKEKAELFRLASLSPYAQMFSDERQRQITEEGWTPEHDNEHVNGELADVAACYAATCNTFKGKGRDDNGHIVVSTLYPESWGNQFFKKCKHDRKRQLIIAGALLIAELERLGRAEKKDGYAIVSFQPSGETHELIGLTFLQNYKELLQKEGVISAELMDKAIKQLKDLEHFSHYTAGLWCTDRPDLIPSDIRNKEEICWQINFWEQSCSKRS